MTVSAHQVLHGYSDGHRLLAGSTRLPPETARQLVVRSDVAPGPNGSRTLSSIAIAEVHMWALTATWPAPEMPRPGSVWSHTLLLAAEALMKLKETGGLLAALRRPQGTGDYAAYRVPVMIEDRSLDLSETGEELTESLVLALYGWPAEPVGVLVADLAEAESALAGVWAQQWPRLRFETTFATRGRLGSTAEQTLQVALAPGRSPSPAISRVADVGRQTPAWILPLVRDVYRPGRLRHFLWRYGPEATRGRSAVPALVRVYEALAGPPKSSQFQPIVAAFPDASEMPSLKRDCLSKDGDAWNVPETVRLRAALDASRATDWRALELGARIAALWPAEPDSAVDLVGHTTTTDVPPEIRAEVFGSVAHVATSDFVRALASANLEAALTIVDTSPSLLTAPGLWAVPAHWQQRLLELVEPGLVEGRGLAASLLAEARDDLVKIALTSQLVNSADVLRTVASEGATELALLRYRRLLMTSQREEAIRAAIANDACWPERLLAAATNSTGRRRLLDRHREGLIEHLEDADLPVQLRVAAALFADGLTRGLDANQLYLKTFPPLHRALVADALPDDAWRDLDGLLPSGNSWDRAERLRKSLLKIIDSQGWDREQLSEVIERSGPEARRIRDLTDKRSDLRKVVDGALDFLGL